jgi:soluble lytic murein transglycosylase-like protein
VRRLGARADLALGALAALCLGVTAFSLVPLLRAPEVSVRLEGGVREVRHPDFERIDAVLATRAPGWGLTLRAHVAQAIAEEAQAAGFDPLLVLAIISVESEFREAAVSWVGARGLMQVRPTTLLFVAEKEGIKLSQKEIEADPSLNVRLGVRYLKSLRELFRGNLDLALMAYNAGPTRVYASARERNLEPFRGYVAAVRRQFASFKLEHGEPNDWTLASREP